MLVLLGRAGRQRRLVLDAVAPAPVLVHGASILVDGGLEAWTAPNNLTNWVETVAGGSTLNQEGAVVHGGVWAARLDIDAGNNAVQLAQAPATAAGGWYRVSAWVRAGAGAPTGKMAFGTATLVSFSLGLAYARRLFTARATGVATSLLLNRDAAPANSVYYDDVAVEPIALASALTGGGDGLRKVGTYEADCTVTSGYQAGVVCCLDSAAAPGNYLHGYVDRASGKAYLVRVAGGVSAELVSGAVGYVAGGTVRVTVGLGAGGLAAAVVRLYYNGAQVGASQVVNLGVGYGTLVRTFRTNEGDTVRVRVRA